MTTAGTSAPSGASASRLLSASAAAIRPRPRSSWLVIVVVALVFGVAMAAIATADRWSTRVVGVPTAGQPAGSTWRIAATTTQPGGIIVARGDVVTAPQATAIATLRGHWAPQQTMLLALGLVFAAAAAIYGHHLRRSTRGRLRRVLLVNLTLIALVMLAAQLVLLGSRACVLAVPIAALAVVPTLAFDRVVGLATGVLAALALAALPAFDLGVGAIVLGQTAIVGLLVTERPTTPWRAAAVASATAALVGAALYAAVALLRHGHLPTGELRVPLASPWIAVFVAGVACGPLALLLLPLYQRACGELTRGQLMALEDLGQPVLRQIAERSPGSWQHSLAMANMAELAANAVGASGRLVRVGAYYHDLGKSLQPKYFIENLEPGETSPHDQLAPEVSCAAIFAHVVDGVAAARRLGVPERVIDFMHMHHGDGVLEFFWARCQELGNPRGLTEADFRYPGVRPDSRETAILAICDAVEAASRTLRRTDDASIRALVQRIVYGKLHLGQLDDSGLAMGDLRRIADSLHATIKHAHHGRIEYPWQRELSSEATATAIASPAGRAESRAETRAERTEPRLDSLDIAARASRPRRISGPGDADPGAVTEAVPASDSGRRARTVSGGTVEADQRGLSTTQLAAMSRARTLPASASSPGEPIRLPLPLAAPAASHVAMPVAPVERAAGDAAPSEVTRPSVMAHAGVSEPQMSALEIIDEVAAVSATEPAWGDGLADRIAAALDAELRVGDETVVRQPSDDDLKRAARPGSVASVGDITRPGVVVDARARGPKTRPPPPPGAPNPPRRRDS